MKKTSKQQKKTSAENTRLLKRLLKVELVETEITKTNQPGCAEQTTRRRQRQARKKALKSSKQHKLDQIKRENRVLNQRLQQTKGCLNNNKVWSTDYARHKKQGRLMSKMQHARYKKGAARNKVKSRGAGGTCSGTCSGSSS